MEASNAPTQMPVIFAANAVGGTYVRTIPTTTTDPTAASLALGFPPETFTAVASGGVFPDGRDINGLGNLLAAPVQWQQAGMFYPYSLAFSTAIGGYPFGAVLQKAVGIGLWVSTVDNNTSDPDTGGANWISFVLATAFEYDVPFFLPYGANPATSNQVGDTPITQFSKLAAQSIFWPFQITNGVNLALPIKLTFTFSSSIANNNFYMQFQYQNISTGGLAASYTSTNDTLVAPGTAENAVTYTSVTATIPAVALTADGIINCVLTRLATNVLDTNTGNLQLVNITMRQ